MQLTGLAALVAVIEWVSAPSTGAVFFAIEAAGSARPALLVACAFIDHGVCRIPDMDAARDSGIAARDAGMTN